MICRISLELDGYWGDPIPQTDCHVHQPTTESRVPQSSSLCSVFLPSAEVTCRLCQNHLNCLLCLYTVLLDLRASLVHPPCAPCQRQTSPFATPTKMHLTPPPPPARVCVLSSLASAARETCPCAWVNDLSGPMFWEVGLWPISQILSLRVYDVPTVSTISRHRLIGAESVYRLHTAMPMCMGKRP